MLAKAISRGFCIPLFVIITFITVEKVLIKHHDFDWARVNNNRNEIDVYFARFFLVILILYTAFKLIRTGKLVYAKSENNTSDEVMQRSKQR